MDNSPTHPHTLPLDELAGFDAGGAADLEVPLVKYLPVVEEHFTFLERRAAAWDYLFALTEAEFPPDPAASARAVDPSQAGPSVPSKHGQPASDTNTSTNTLFYGGWQEAGSGSPADANPLAYWEQLSELDLNMMFAVDGEQPLAQNRNGDGGFEGGESAAGKDGDVVHYREEANPNPNFEENQVFDQAATTDDGSTLQENLWDSGTGVWAHPRPRVARSSAGQCSRPRVVPAFQDNRQEVYETALSPTDVGEPASEAGDLVGCGTTAPGNALRPAPLFLTITGMCVRNIQSSHLMNKPSRKRVPFHRPSGSELRPQRIGSAPDPAVAGLKRKYEDGPQFSAFHAAGPGTSKRAKSDDVPEKRGLSRRLLADGVQTNLLNILGPRDQSRAPSISTPGGHSLRSCSPKTPSRIWRSWPNTREVANQFATWRLAMWEKGKAPRTRRSRARS
ncbi:unnamed protein product [Mycena citricolor]|uniref:Uncharacterized protein n=1 Tax=Mycena citricolor TaxID=2018698 RepID=A0AAD2HK17_9AGAR|nr:unnamed protein product [Mycena citricolor]